MELKATARRFGAATNALYRRYAAWLVSISWKRFIVLSILLMIAAGVLSEIPPFSWTLSTTTTKSMRPVHISRPGVEIKIDKHGVRIVRKADPERGRLAREITIDEHGVLIDGNPPAAPKAEVAPKADGAKSDSESDELAALAEDVRREVAEALGEEIRGEIQDALGDIGTRERVVRVRLGDHLPPLAFLFIMLSAVIKVAYAGRIKAEAKAAEAQEVADAESLKRQVAEAKMAALEAQIEPHFLFNTLASIEHLIEVDPPRASRMQKNLIALLRGTMPGVREKAPTLGRELDVVRPYVEILKVRMEDRLRAGIDVPEGLQSADFPPMMLQSLVENAIKHGLEPKAEGGTLDVKAQIVHGKLHVSVADTGVGFGRAPTAGTGTGLANIRERLKLLYGTAAEMRIAENAPSGTLALIILPYSVRA